MDIIMSTNNDNLLCKRISKMDSFLRKTALQDSVRFYERCIIEKAKRTFLPAYVILTDKALLITQNPPKFIMDSIPLAQVYGIDLVADRHPLLTGGSDNKALISQHMCIQYNEKSKNVVPGSREENNNCILKNSKGSNDFGRKTQCLTVPLTIRLAYETIPSTETIEPDSDFDNMCHEEPFVRPGSVSSWRNSNDFGVTSDNPEVNLRPNSADMTKRSSVKEKILSKLFANKASLGENILNHKTDQKEKTRNLNVYLYDSSSTFLSQCLIIWRRQILKTTLSLEKRIWNQESVIDGLRSAEQIFVNFMGNSGRFPWKTTNTEIDKINSNIVMEQTHKSLSDFHKYLLKYNSLKFICWKNTELMNSLLDLLMQLENNRERKLEFSIERLVVFIILLDIFKILMESYSGQALKLKSRSSILKDECQIITILLQSAFSFGSVSKVEQYLVGSSKSIDIIYNPQKFCSLKWTNLPYCDIYQVLAMGHNISVSLVHEILSTSSCAYVEPLLSKLLSELNLEHYLLQSVTQIIYLLWSKSTPLTPSCCVLLLCHLSVLRTLVNKQRKVKLFLQEKFSEEFRYFLPENCVQERICDEYPIKWKLVDLFNSVRNDILLN